MRITTKCSASQKKWGSKSMYRSGFGYEKEEKQKSQRENQGLQKKQVEEVEDVWATNWKENEGDRALNSTDGGLEGNGLRCLRCGRDGVDGKRGRCQASTGKCKLRTNVLGNDDSCNAQEIYPNRHGIRAYEGWLCGFIFVTLHTIKPALLNTPSPVVLVALGCSYEYFPKP